MSTRIRQVTHQFDADGREYTLVDVVEIVTLASGQTAEVPWVRMGRAEAEKHGFTLEALNGAVAVAAMSERDDAVKAKETAEAERERAREEKAAAEKDRDDVAQAALQAVRQATSERNEAAQALQAAVSQNAELRAAFTDKAKELDALVAVSKDMEARLEAHRVDQIESGERDPGPAG